MSIYSASFALLTDAKATPLQLIGNDKSGVKLRIKDFLLEKTAGTGTQFLVRFYKGWTADTDHEIITSVTVPAVADDWADAGSTQAPSTPDPAKRFSTFYKDFSEGWTDANTPRTGLGVYIDLVQVAGSSATNAIITKTDIGV